MPSYINHIAGKFKFSVNNKTIMYISQLKEKFRKLNTVSLDWAQPEGAFTADFFFVDRFSNALRLFHDQKEKNRYRRTTFVWFKLIILTYYM